MCDIFSTSLPGTTLFSLFRLHRIPRPDGTHRLSPGGGKYFSTIERVNLALFPLYICDQERDILDWSSMEKQVKVLATACLDWMSLM